MFLHYVINDEPILRKLWNGVDKNVRIFTFYIKIIFSIFRPQTQSTRAVITLDIGEPPTTQITDQKSHWLIVKILFPVQNNNLKIFSNPKLNYYFNLNKFWL